MAKQPEELSFHQILVTYMQLLPNQIKPNQNKTKQKNKRLCNSFGVSTFSCSQMWKVFNNRQGLSYSIRCIWQREMALWKCFKTRWTFVHFYPLYKRLEIQSCRPQQYRNGAWIQLTILQIFSLVNCLEKGLKRTTCCVLMTILNFTYSNDLSSGTK